ncbi:hypothetical protein AO825_07615 [Pectobacterium brasiliense]|nr:hypothetical protein KS44_14650 [Pectobacterium brasiliense]KHT21082.1 hypothetical protein RC97_03270 [Pectobacterium brasiliense]KRF64215.1 hypothetical protein AO825_07615 [Pectobacterium brasiliense]
MCNGGTAAINAKNLLGGLGQNSVEQAGETLLHITAAQSVDVRSADVGGMQQARVAQHAKMVRHAGFWPTAVKFATRCFFLYG